VPGHWEGDLLCGSSNSYIITLVERHTRYVMLGKIPSRDTRTVVNALIKLARKLPDQLYQSLTWDRGVELTDHKRFTMATDIQVYFLITALILPGPSIEDSAASNSRSGHRSRCDTNIPTKTATITAT
jgi:hypothetical protein